MTTQTPSPKLADLTCRIRSAASGVFGPDQQRIAETGLAWLDLLLRKNADYGSTVFAPPALAPNLDPGAAILVRMSDKIGRIAALAGRAGAGEVAETLNDTITDLGAYCLLWLARPQQTGADSGEKTRSAEIEEARGCRLGCGSSDPATEAALDAIIAKAQRQRRPAGQPPAIDAFDGD